MPARPPFLRERFDQLKHESASILTLRADPLLGFREGWPDTAIGVLARACIVIRLSCFSTYVAVAAQPWHRKKIKNKKNCYYY